jgi:hypothetical protein
VAQENGKTPPRAAGDLPERLRAVARLIDDGRLGEARIELESTEAEPKELVELVRLKLSVAARELDPSSALQSVIAFLRTAPRHPAALGLYQEFSLLQYEAGRSCPSYSHPPPSGSR